MTQKYRERFLQTCMFLALSVLTMMTNAQTLPQTGTVSGYLNYSSQGKELIFVKLSTSVAEGCNATGRYVMSSDNLHFKGTRAAIMAAYHSQSVMQVMYAANCSTWNNSFNLLYICTGNIPC